MSQNSTLVRALANHVGKLLSDSRATDPDFFAMLAEELERNDYRIEAHQRGIGGTYLCIVNQKGD